MSRVTCVALLLVVLIASFYHSTASHAKIRATKVHIRKCGCRVLRSGMIRCRSPLLPEYVKYEDLLKCFCHKSNQHKFPEFKAACRVHLPSQGRGTPL